MWLGVADLYNTTSDYAVCCLMMSVTWCCRYKRWCSELFSDVCELVLQCAVQWCLWLGVAGASNDAVSCSVMCVNWCWSELFGNPCDLVLQVQAMMQWAVQWCWRCSVLCLSKKNAYHTTSFSSLMELRRIFCRWMVLVHCQIFCQMGGRC